MDHHSLNLRLGTIRIKFWLLGMAFVGGMTFAYYYFATTPTLETILTFIAALVGVTAALITAVYEARGFQAAKEQVELDRKQKAFDIACRWNSEHMKEVRSDFRKALPKLNTATGDKLLEELKTHDLSLSLIFGFFEEVALAIKNNLADEDVLYDQLKSAVTENFKRFGIWIDHIQKSQPSAYCQGETLSARWTSRIKDEKNNS